MSTKCTIVHADDFHIYEDWADGEDMDANPVHIELDSVEVANVNYCAIEGSPSCSVFVQISRPMWIRIRDAIVKKGYT